MTSSAEMKKILEISVESYLDAEVRRFGGITWKNNPRWYLGIPDRTVCLCGYMCVVELKRPKGGRFSTGQKMWRKFIDKAGTPWHHIKSHDEVDLFIQEVRNHATQVL